MGISSLDVKPISGGAKQMLDTLSTAETRFWENLKCVSSCGQVLDVREAAISLALIQSFQTSLAKNCAGDARVAVGLLGMSAKSLCIGLNYLSLSLDASAAITLHRELIDFIDQKFPEVSTEDLNWPSASGHIGMATVDTDEDTAMDLRAYWKSVRDRYQSNHCLENPVSTSQVDLLPANWTVVNISITADKSTMLLARQRPQSEPLLFCVPLERHGRGDESADEQFLFDDAMHQLDGILQESDQSAKDAKNVPSEDRDAKAAWWARRVALDRRLRDLLDNIEFCWLGAFKVRWFLVLYYALTKALHVDDTSGPYQFTARRSE